MSVFTLTVYARAQYPNGELDRVDLEAARSCETVTSSRDSDGPGYTQQFVMAYIEKCIETGWHLFSGPALSSFDVPGRSFPGAAPDRMKLLVYTLTHSSPKKTPPSLRSIDTR